MQDELVGKFLRFVVAAGRSGPEPAHFGPCWFWFEGSVWAAPCSA